MCVTNLNSKLANTNLLKITVRKKRVILFLLTFNTKYIDTKIIYNRLSSPFNYTGYVASTSNQREKCII